MVQKLTLPVSPENIISVTQHHLYFLLSQEPNLSAHSPLKLFIFVASPYSGKLTNHLSVYTSLPAPSNTSPTFATIITASYYGISNYHIHITIATAVQHRVTTKLLINTSTTHPPLPQMVLGPIQAP